MPWVKLDDGFPFNRKAILAGKDGRALYVTALCWTAQQLTDGVIDSGAVPMLAAVSGVDNGDEVAAHLVAVGLWEASGDTYVIHDFHDYNPSSEEVQAMRKARAEAGRRGGLAKAANQEPSEPPSNPVANGLANATANAKQNPAPYPYPFPSPTTSTTTNARENGFAAVLSEHGIMLNGQVQAEMWQDIYDAAGPNLFKAALDEAVRVSPRLPGPAYVDGIVQRCLKEGTMPGQRSSPPSRASPPRAPTPEITSFRNPITGEVERL